MGSKLFPLAVKVSYLVEHGKYSTGEVYYSLGFKFGKLSYISDANAIPENSKNIIRGSKIIILDALRRFLI